MDLAKTRKRNPSKQRLLLAVGCLLFVLPACAEPPADEETVAGEAVEDEAVEDEAVEDEAVEAGEAVEDEAMERMLREIERDTRETVAYTGQDQLSARVLEAMRSVPRRAFVPAGEASRAYLDRPLPIGSGQTISQPFIVALMTEMADITEGERVLEVGTGSGYQAAVLAELTDEVYSIEILPELAARARATLDAQGYAKVQTRVGDGWHGWPEEAPFDAILVTAAAERIPPPLLAQLAAGGRLVIPIKEGAFSEQLTLVIRRQDGGLESRELLPVRFVPLTGEH